jgi:coproporphyrinogen III oxidase
MGHEGGGGRTRVIENGTFLKRRNISAVHEIAKQCKMFGVGKADFFCGLSLVLHQESNGAYGSRQLALF